MKISNELHMFLLKEDPFGWEDILKNYNLNDEFIEILSTMTDLSQLRRIREALQGGMAIDKIKKFANPAYTGKQMEQIILGYERCLSQRQIDLYCNPKFHHTKMKQIRLGFEDGLSYEQVKSFADPSLHFRDMAAIRKQLTRQNISRAIDSDFKKITK